MEVTPSWFIHLNSTFTWIWIKINPSFNEQHVWSHLNICRKLQPEKQRSVRSARPLPLISLVVLQFDLRVNWGTAPITKLKKGQQASQLNEVEGITISRWQQLTWLRRTVCSHHLDSQAMRGESCPTYITFYCVLCRPKQVVITSFTFLFFHIWFPSSWSFF